MIYHIKPNADDLLIAGAVWVTVHGFNLPDDFIGLPRPDVAAIIAITLVWLAWSICKYTRAPPLFTYVVQMSHAQTQPSTWSG